MRIAIIRPAVAPRCDLYRTLADRQLAVLCTYLELLGDILSAAICHRQCSADPIGLFTNICRTRITRLISCNFVCPTLQIKHILHYSGCRMWFTIVDHGLRHCDQLNLLQTFPLGIEMVLDRLVLFVIINSHLSSRDKQLAISVLLLSPSGKVISLWCLEACFLKSNCCIIIQLFLYWFWFWFFSIWIISMINKQSLRRRISINCIQRDISSHLQFAARVSLFSGAILLRTPIEERLPGRRGNFRCRLDVRMGVFCILSVVSGSYSAAFTHIIRNRESCRFDVIWIKRDVAVKLCVEIVKGKTVTVFCRPSNPRVALRDMDDADSGSLLNQISFCVQDRRQIIFIDRSAVIN